MNHSVEKLLHWYRDAISAAVLLLIFACFLYASKNINVMLSSSGVTAKFFPILICTIGIILCAVNVVSGLIRGNAARRQELKGAAPVEPVSHERRIVAVKSALSIAIIVLYLILIDLLGFVPASILYLFGQICLLTDSWKKKWPLYLAISIAVSIVCYLFFRSVFHLMLPKGIMPF